MASLRDVIKDEYDFINEGIAWVVIYKNGRSWDSWRFYEEDGNYDDGYIFSEDDVAKMKEIVYTDRKAICINGNYTGFAEDFTLKEMEDKVFWMYENRINLLNGDFLGSLVCESNII